MEQVVQLYSKLAPSYDSRWGWYCETCWGSVMPMLPDLSGKWVLDAGCGTGLITDHLANEVGNWGQVVGIDATDDMLEKARCRVSDRRNVTLHKAPLHQVPSRDRSFDVIVCTNVFHYLDDLAPVFREWRRVLNTDGEVVVVDWDASTLPIMVGHRWWRFTNRAYRKSWRQEEIEAGLKNHGFSILDSKKVSLSRFWKVWMVRARKD